MNERILYFLLCCITIFAFSQFLLGFFPMKNVLPGKASLQNFTVGERLVTQPERKYDRLVLVLIDALRADFVSDNGRMPFVQSQIKAGIGKRFVMRAHPPTVTLPRIKALTSGTIPGFVDVVLNFDSKSLSVDNLITQAKDTGKQMVFFGDDTWLKLFPDHFVRSEGTTSFFVTDYTEVDINVTRHIDTELATLDWDIMILHYLGLDHIGHTAGPRSPLVPPKLLEMDSVIKTIFNALAEKETRSLMLVCGDHGMADQGGHGGASDKEVMVPAVFLSPTVDTPGPEEKSGRDLLQVDLAPTLAVLLGLPIPGNSLGQVMVEALRGYTDSETLAALHVNAEQVQRLLQDSGTGLSTEAGLSLFHSAVELHIKYIKELGVDRPRLAEVIRMYEMAIDTMTTKLLSSQTTYDMYSMVTAVLVLFMTLLVLACKVLKEQPGIDVFTLSLPAVSLVSGLIIFGHVTVCTSQSCHSSFLCGRSLASILTQSFLFLCVCFLSSQLMSTSVQHHMFTKLGQQSHLCTLLVAGTLFHSLSFGSSSCVEEEHQTWYFLVMTFNLIAMVKQCSKSIVNYLHYKNKSPSDLEYSQSSDVKKTSYASDNYDQIIDNHFDYEQNFYSKGHSANSSIDQKTNYEHSKKHVTKQTGFRVQWAEILPWKQIFSVFFILFLGRILRTMNQTGNKWLDLPDVGDWLIRPENKPILSMLVPFSLSAILFIKGHHVSADSAFLTAGLLGCYGYRIATGAIDIDWLASSESKIISQGHFESHIVYSVVFIMNMKSLYILYIRWQISDKRTQILKVIETFHLSWIILMCLLLRPHNTALVAMVILQELFIWKSILQPLSLPAHYLTLYFWWMGQATFFLQGNSNSLSTVDVGAGYVGLDGYSPTLVAVLLFCSTYAGPVYWLICLIKHLIRASLDNHQQKESVIWTTYIRPCIQSVLLERVFTVCLYSVVVTTQRYHLFVWTVFSPKLLYEGTLTVLTCAFCMILLLIR